MRGVCKDNFTSLLAVARTRALTQDNIQAAFRATGTWPLNRRKILQEIEVLYRAKKKQLPDSPGYTPPLRPQTSLENNLSHLSLQDTRVNTDLTKTPAPYRIKEMDLEEVDALPIPAGARELRQRTKGLLNAIGTGDSQSFRLRLEAAKIARCAEQEMLEKEEIKRQNVELEV